jgi:hypothetical protein
MSDAQHLLSAKRPCWAVGNEDVIVSGSWQLDSSVSATHVKSGTQKGIGFSVTYAATGVFTVTLFNAVHDIKFAIAQLSPASGVVEHAAVSGVSASAGTITIQGSKEDGTSGIPAADTLTNDGIISFMAVVRMRAADPK